MSGMRSLARVGAPALVALVALSSLSACFMFRPAPPIYEPSMPVHGLVVQDVVVPDEGPRAKTGDTLTLHYTGRLADGTVFDSSYERGEPVTFVLGAGEVPPGLEHGLVGLRRLGSRTLTVPGELGYGAEGLPGLVPPNATLTFEVELLELQPTETP